MSEPVLPTHEALLQLCAAAAPRPWYPKEYAKSSGVPRDSLYSPLNDLRIAGLLKLTEWTKDSGQGYELTELGQQVLRNPVHLAQLRAGLQTPPAKLPAEEDEEPQADTLTPYERGEAARSALFEPQPPRVTPVLLLVNLIAFGVSFAVATNRGVPIGEFATKGNADALLDVGGLSPLGLLRGEWWRLLTTAFLHFGLLHLLLNMFALWSLGRFESLWGPPRYLIIYLTSVLGGSCAAMIWNPPTGSEMAVVAGASGAIWGLMTSLLAWVLINRSHIQTERLAEYIPNFGILFVIGIVVSFLPNVGASAHFGGGIVGFIVGSLLQVQRYAVGPRRTAATVLIALLPFVCFAALAEVMEKDPRWQRIKNTETERLSDQAAQQFKKDVVPAVEKVAAAWSGIEKRVTDACNEPPDKRNAETVRKLRDELKSLLDASKAARDKIDDKKAENEKHEQARKAALEMLAAVKDLVEHIDGVLEKKEASIDKERVEKVNTALTAWREAVIFLPQIFLPSSKAQ